MAEKCARERQMKHSRCFLCSTYSIRMASTCVNCRYPSASAICTACRKSRVPFMREMQSFPDGAVLLEHCNQMGLEDVVSKRLAARYVSGPGRSWVKTKCAGWLAANQHRHKLFER